MIVRDGIKRMYQDGEEIFYYITVMNERYVQPAMPEGVEEGIIKGMYRFASSEIKDSGKKGPSFRKRRHHERGSLGQGGS